MNIQQFKAANPAYADVPDLELADALHSKFYSEIPKDQFLSQVGLGKTEPVAVEVPQGGGGGRGSVNPPMASEPQPQREDVGAAFGVYPSAMGSKRGLVQEKKKTSVLEGVQMPETQVTPETQARTDAMVQKGKKVLADQAAFIAGENRTERSAVDYLKDIGLSTTKVTPTVVKNLSDIANLLTGGQAGFGDVSQYIGQALQRIENKYGSKAAQEERKAFGYLMASDAGPGDIAKFMVSNPLLAADMGITTAGSMAVPIGAVGAAGKVFGKLGPQSATAVANTANVLMNAGDTFTQTEGDVGQKLLAAGIAGAGSAVAGKLTGGGLEGQIGRQMAGRNAGLVGARSVLGEVGKEAGQEFGESASQSIGQDVGEFRAPDIQKAIREGTVGAVLSPIASGPISALNAAANAKQPTDLGDALAYALESGQTVAPGTPSNVPQAVTPTPIPAAAHIAAIGKAESVDEAIASAQLAVSAPTAADIAAKITDLEAKLTPPQEGPATAALEAEVAQAPVETAPVVEQPTQEVIAEVPQTAVQMQTPQAPIEQVAPTVGVETNVQDQPARIGTEAQAAPTQAPEATGSNVAVPVEVPAGTRTAPVESAGVGGRPTASWVIKEKGTGNVVMETFDKAKVDALNTEKYEAVPILDHLVGINRAIKEAESGVAAPAKNPKLIPVSQRGVQTPAAQPAPVNPKLVPVSQRAAAESAVPQKPVNPKLIPVSQRQRDVDLPDALQEKPMFSRARKTPEFKAWHEGSKVKGVVYHATGSDFNAFDTSKSDLGAHFGTEEQANKVATGMRLDMREGTNIMPVWLSIKNPLRLNDTGTFHADGIALQLEKKGILPKGEGKRIEKEISEDWRARQKYNPVVKQAILDAGYDGVVYKNTQEGRGDSYIAFSPEQIKSATGNVGTFDPSNPDIRFSRDASRQAPQQRTDIVRRAVQRIADRWDNAPEIVVVKNMADASVPQRVREADEAQKSNGATGEPEGFFYGGKVYIVADEMRTLDDIARVLFHETLGHYGLRGAFGDALNPVLKNVARLRPDLMKAKAAQYGIDITLPTDGTPITDEMREDVELGRLYVAEEVLAELAQTKPESSLVRRAIAIIRTWLRENIPGFDNLKLSDSELIQNYILPARGWVERGEAASIRGEELAFARDAQGDSLAYNKVKEYLPEIDNYAYDAKTRQFVSTAEGYGAIYVPESALEILASEARARGFPAGIATIKRAILSGTVLQGQDLLSPLRQAGDEANQPGGSIAGVLYSRSGGWNAPPDTRTDKLIYNLQDGRVDLKRVQKAIEETGKKIDENFDARMAETLYAGRVAKRSEDFLKVEVKPLLESMAKNNVSMDELSDYLLARHAPERNEQIAKVNPAMPDGGAGSNSKGDLMTTQAANDYIANMSPIRRALMVTLAKKVDALTQGTRDLLVREGLEKAETVDAWTGAYKHYVPLFKDEAEAGTPHPQGSGFSVKGSSSKRAMGSTKQVTNMLAHVLMQREAAITRAEKNRVGLALYGLALSEPNSDFWTTIRPQMSDADIEQSLTAMGVDPAAIAGMERAPTIMTINKSTGQVQSTPNPMYKNRPNALVLKVGGEDRVILFNEGSDRAMRLAENLKNLDGLTSLDLAGSVIGKATRFMASMATQYNPAFGFVNLVRDTQGALVNLSSTELAGKQAAVLANVPSAIKGIARDIRGGGRTPWSDLYQQFQDDGGQTGYKEMWRTAEDRAKAIEKEINSLTKAGKLTPGKMVHATLDLLDGFNTTLENAVRLSAYKEALDQGMSRPAAAKLARELTVDFNRKGRAAREISPLYAFFNAALQGTARTVQTLKGPAGAKIIAGGLGLGVMQALMLATAGYDDEDVPEFVKTRALIIPMYPFNAKKYISIPLPLGLHVLPNTGRVLAELSMSKGKDIGKKSFDAIGEIAGSFNPLGGGNIFTTHGLLTTLAPTVVDPLIDLATNTNFAGNKISKETFAGDKRPGYMLGKESTARMATGEVYKGIAQGVNYIMSGGDNMKRGVGGISPTPEQVRYIIGTIGGGLYREVEKSLNAAQAIAQNEPVKSSQIPLGGRFYGEVDEAQVTKFKFFSAMDKINEVKSQMKIAEKSGDAEAIQRIMEANPVEVSLMRSFGKVQQNLSELNKIAMESIGDLETLKQVDAARDALMSQSVEIFKQMEEAQKK